MRKAAWVVVPLTRIAVAVLPLTAVVRLAGTLARSKKSGMPAEQIVETVESVAKRLPGTNCLATAIAAAFLLARHGHPVAIRLGVAPGEKRAAHAWLECDGREMLEAPAPGKFIALPPLRVSTSPPPASSPSAASET